MAIVAAWVRRRCWPRRGARSLTLALAAFGALPAVAAGVSPVHAINEARAHACAGPLPRSPLVETRELDVAAAHLARGVSLHDALAALPLRPAAATSIQLRGIADERGIARALARRYCRDIDSPDLREVGIAWAPDRLFIIVAAPLPVPSPRDRPAVEHEVLRLVNAARAEPRRCGQVAYPAAPPVTLSPPLSRVAAAHSEAMAARDELEHNDPDGTTPAGRVRRAGYAARVVGENVASGVPTAAAVVAGWLDSPGHCSNIMDRRFTEMGVAYAPAYRSPAAIYWTQLLATPRY